MCIRSFIDNGHEFHLYTYDEVNGIPEGTVIKDGNDILLADKIFCSNATGSYAPFSDWFRYKLLYERGGWWVDTDTICIKPFDFIEEIVIHGCDDGLYTTNPLRFPKGHAFMHDMERICREYKNPAKARFGDIGGPLPLSKMILQHGMQKHAKPYFTFCLMPWFVAMNKTFADGIALHPNAYCLHFGNESLRKVVTDKNAQFDSGSLFEQLKAKHNIHTSLNARRITSQELHAAMVDKNLDKFERRKARKKKIAIGLAVTIATAIALLTLAV